MITTERAPILNGAVKAAPDAGMTYSEASRRIVERVNASRGNTIEYRSMGVVNKWTMRAKADIRIVLESLSLTLRVGVAGEPQHIRDDGKPPQTEDVERVTRQILEYFAQPTPAH